MSIEAKMQYLGRIYDRYQRAGRQHKSKILDEFCAVCGYHRKAALRRLNRPLDRPAQRRPGPKPTYDAARKPAAFDRIMSRIFQVPVKAADKKKKGK